MLTGYQVEITAAYAEDEGLICLDCVRRQAGNDVGYERWLSGLSEIPGLSHTIRYVADEYHTYECESWLDYSNLDDLLAAVSERDPELAADLDPEDAGRIKSAWWDAGCWEDVPLDCARCGAPIEH